MISPYSYYKSVKYVTSLLGYKENAFSDLRIEDGYYDGLNGENPPFKVVYPKRPNGQTIILYPGASPYAEQHPKMIMLAEILARSGFITYIPRIPPLKMLDVSEINVHWISQFYNWIQEEKKSGPQQTFIVGMSYSGALMLKALMDPFHKLSNAKSIMTYGTYFDAATAIKFLLSGEFSINGKPYFIKPNEWGLIVVFQNYLTNLELDWDTSGVKAAISLQICEDFSARDKVIRKLPMDQKKIIQAVIKGVVTPEVKKICHAIIKNEENTFNKLSPKYWCEKINRKIFILHGSQDSMIPHTESIQMAEKINNSELLISNIFEHKEIISSLGIIAKSREVFRLFRFFAKFFDHYEN